MSYQNLPQTLDIAASLFLARLVGVYTLTSSDVAVTGNYYGMTAGAYLYSFVEETYDPVTGLPVDAAPGRQTSNASGLVGSQSEPVGAAPLAMFALELSNNLLTIPAPTPTGYTNPGPYVWMRQRGVVGSTASYEFGWDDVTAIAILNSGTPNSDGLYDATIQYYNPSSETWTSGPNVWLRDANS